MSEILCGRLLASIAGPLPVKQSSDSLLPAEVWSMPAQALIRKYMPIGVIALILLFVLWARWFFYSRR